jgi:hypothetical protein
MISTEHVSAVWSKLYLTLAHRRRIGIGRCRWVSAQGDVTPSDVYGSVRDVLQLKVYRAEEQLCLVRDFRLPLRCRFLFGFLTLEDGTSRLIRNVGTELTILRCVTSQNISCFNCALCVRVANVYRCATGVESNFDRS